MFKKYAVRYLIVLKFILILLLAGNVHATQDTLRVLFIGNSYTYFNNLAQTVSALSDSTNLVIRAEHSTYPGARLADHYFGINGLKTIEKIRSGKYKAVVLQSFSMQPVQAPDSLIKYTTLLADIAKKAGAKVYLYETWAREKVPQYQLEISKAYAEAGKKTESTVVPVGSVWKLARETYPSIKLFREDGSHPSPLGTYLTAMVFVREFTGEFPKGNTPDLFYRDASGLPFYLMSIDQLEKEFTIRVIKEIYMEREHEKSKQTKNKATKK